MSDMRFARDMPAGRDMPLGRDMPFGREDTDKPNFEESPLSPNGHIARTFQPLGKVGFDGVRIRESVGTMEGYPQLG